MLHCIANVFICFMLLYSTSICSKTISLSTKTSINSQFVDQSAVYLCSDVIDLMGDTICIPRGATISFNGGRIQNGTLHGSNTVLTGTLLNRFSNVNFTGSFCITHISFKSFYNYDTDTDLLRGMLNLLFSGSDYCILDLEPSRVYDVCYHKLSYAHSIYEYRGVKNKIIRGNNSLINDLRKRSLVSYQTYDGIFLFSDSHNISIHDLNYQNLNEDYLAIVENGKVIFEDGLENQIGYVGTSFILLQNDCSKFDIKAKIKGARYGIKSGDYSHFWLSGNYGVKDSKFNITAFRTGYPISIEIGDSLNIFVHSELHHRAAYLCGISNSNIVIEAKDICIAPIHCLLSDTHYSKGDKKHANYKACRNLRVSVTDMGSSVTTNGDCFCAGFQTYNNEPFYNRNHPLVWENIYLQLSKKSRSDKIGLFVFYQSNPKGLQKMIKYKDVFRNIVISGEDSFVSSQYALRIKLNEYCYIDSFNIKIKAPHSPAILDNVNNCIFDLTDSSFSCIYHSGRIQVSTNANRYEL